MKIGFVSRYAPEDRDAWSGTTFKLLETLSADYSVTHIPYGRDMPALAYGWAVKALAKVRRRNTLIDFTHIVSKRTAGTVDLDLVQQVDVLFFPGGSTCLAALETDKPIVYLTDATFRSLYEYYPSIDNFMKFNRRQGDEIESQALQKATKVIVSSDWARHSVTHDYGQDPAKVRTIEFGANLLSDDPVVVRRFCESARHKLRVRGSSVDLLFLAKDWTRKGGDIAVECCRVLNQLGINSNLHIVGPEIPQHHLNERFIVNHGYLNKNDPEQFRRFNELLAISDLLLVPTRAECSPIAFCEAAAHGLPIFTFDTGGVGNYIVDSATGYKLPLTSSGSDFASIIFEVISSGRLEHLRENSFHLYATRLNWKHWVKEFHDFTLDLPGDHGRGSSVPTMRQ